MTRTTLDASVALAWLLEEMTPGWVAALLADIESCVTHAMVPSLFWLEVGNALVRDGSLTDEQAMDGLLRYEALGVETVEVGPPLRLRALQLAREKRLTMYDATYLAVAEATNAPLATLDTRLQRAAASMGLSAWGGLGGVSEPEAPYGHGPEDPVSLAAIGAALAEMRRQYSAR